MKFVRCLNFKAGTSRIFTSIAFYEQIKITTPLKRTDQHDEQIKEIKTRFAKDTIMAVPPSEYPSINTSNPLTSELVA